MNYIRERLAENAHKQWANWMNYLFSKGTFNPDGSFTLPGEYVINLKKQMRTSYQDLGDKEQELDREQADRIIKLLHLDPNL